MTDSSRTHIHLILDRTGSMEAIRDDTIGGVNGFIDDQRQHDGECTFTLVQFDSQDPYEVVHDRQPIDQVPKLTRQTFVPRASTPLLDAIGRGINDLGARLAALPEQERPGTVIFVIQTDGPRLIEGSRRDPPDVVLRDLVDGRATRSSSASMERHRRCRIVGASVLKRR